MVESFWTEQAEKARAAGYTPGNRWEKMRERYLRGNQPKLVAQLEAKGEFQDFLTFHVWEAQQYGERLESEGTPSSTAEELALALLFPEQS
jgi:hypothetical protein